MMRAHEPVTNEKVDETLLGLLTTRGSMKFGQIRVVVSMDVGNRQIDRRLQALRRAGKLKFDTKRGWSVERSAT